MMLLDRFFIFHRDNDCRSFSRNEFRRDDLYLAPGSTTVSTRTSVAIVLSIIVFCLAPVGSYTIPRQCGNAKPRSIMAN